MTQFTPQLPKLHPTTSNPFATAVSNQDQVLQESGRHDSRTYPNLTESKIKYRQRYYSDMRKILLVLPVLCIYLGVFIVVPKWEADGRIML